MPHRTSAAPAPAGPRLLETIHGPADVKALAPDQLPQLAQEIREELIAVTARNGGHIGPNLGVVELTLALHRVFDSPRDAFVFDVAHQGYVHKLLTGRGGEFFRRLRQSGGASGFLTRSESPHDSFGAGHAGTALSAALGMATARDLRGSAEHVVAVCGDAAFTCGVTLEALNNVVSATQRLIVVLNDNEWSIARNVGAISHYLNRLSTNPTYNRIHHDVEAFFKSFPAGVEMNRVYTKWKRETKDFFVESSLFEKFGLRYLGPVDGHDLGPREEPRVRQALRRSGARARSDQEGSWPAGGGRSSGAFPRGSPIRPPHRRRPQERGRHPAELPGRPRPGPDALRPGRPEHRGHHRRDA
jgi:1-deoxy-D-xylulose-5-phosphate synthase